MSRASTIPWWRTHATRLALIHALMFACCMLLLLGFLYWSTAGYLAAQTDATIEAEIEGLRDQYRQRGLDGLSQIIGERIRRDPRGESVYLFATPTFRALAGNVTRWPDVPIDERGWVEFVRDVDGEARRTRARAFVLAGELRLLVGRDVQALSSVRSLIERALGWGVLLSVGLAVLVGLASARVTLRRLATINSTSKESMNGDLTRRIPEAGSGDEFDQLAGNLNAMLDEIESLMASVRSVSDNVAHDLRTPLTRLRNRLEELRKATCDDPNGALVETAIEDVDQLLDAFRALLRIARLESGRVERNFAEVDLGAMAQDAFELYEAVATDAGLTLRQRTVSDAMVLADRDLLFQALVNLIDNAIKYTPEGGVVTLEVARRGDESSIAVVDDGPGITPEHRDKMFQRFYRVDSSRTTPGHGLGLSLVAAVVRHHQAELNVFDNAPGLTVEVRFG